MTQTKTRVLAFFVAAVLLGESCALWTSYLSGVLSLRLVSSLLGNEEIVSVALRDTKPVKFDVFRPAAPLHVSEVEDVKLPPEEGPQETGEELDEVMSDSASVPDSTDSELRQWEIQHWLTLSIPKLNLRTGVLLPSRVYWDAKEWVMLEEQMQVGLLYGATAYPHSVAPGRRGALIIAGHSSPPNERAKESANGTIFAQLPSIGRGDEILVTARGETVTFRVRETAVVPQTATEILRQDYEQSVLKLITCYPVGTTKDRMVVLAERVER